MLTRVYVSECALCSSKVNIDVMEIIEKFYKLL